jgi:hypothetical protein
MKVCCHGHADCQTFAIVSVIASILLEVSSNKFSYSFLYLQGSSQSVSWQNFKPCYIIYPSQSKRLVLRLACLLVNMDITLLSQWKLNESWM